MVLLHPVEAGIIVVRFHVAPQTYGHDVMVAYQSPKLTVFVRIEVAVLKQQVMRTLVMK